MGLPPKSWATCPRSEPRFFDDLLLGKRLSAIGSGKAVKRLNRYGLKLFGRDRGQRRVILVGILDGRVTLITKVEAIVRPPASSQIAHAQTHMDRERAAIRKRESAVTLQEAEPPFLEISRRERQAIALTLTEEAPANARELAGLLEPLGHGQGR